MKTMTQCIHRTTAAVHVANVCSTARRATAAAAAAAPTAAARPSPWMQQQRRWPLAAAPAAGGGGGTSGSGSSDEYSFASAGARREPGVRRNRAADKRANAELSGVVRGLVTMTPKQLAAVSHLLTAEQLEEVGLAARLPRNNQGRKRHENRVAALLRAEAGADDGDALSKLAEAVALSQAGGAAALFVDADAADMVDDWVAALRGGDERALSEAAAALGGGGDVDALRRLTAELAAASAAAEAEAAAGDASSTGDGNGSGSGGGAKEVEVAESVLGDPELLALITQRRPRGGKGGGGAAMQLQQQRRRTPPMAPAEKKLRALLRPAALRVLAARRGNGGGE